MIPIKWSGEALRNLKEIKEYISIDAAYYAKRMINHIIIACRLLQQLRKLVSLQWSSKACYCDV